MNGYSPPHVNCEYCRERYSHLLPCSGPASRPFSSLPPIREEEIVQAQGIWGPASLTGKFTAQKSHKYVCELSVSHFLLPPAAEGGLLLLGRGSCLGFAGKGTESPSKAPKPGMVHPTPCWSSTFINTFANTVACGVPPMLFFGHRFHVG